MPGERHQLGVTQPHNKARGLGRRCQRPEAASRRGSQGAWRSDRGKSSELQGLPRYRRAGAGREQPQLSPTSWTWQGAKDSHKLCPQIPTISKIFTKKATLAFNSWKCDSQFKKSFSFLWATHFLYLKHSILWVQAAVGPPSSAAGFRFFGYTSLSLPCQSCPRLKELPVISPTKRRWILLLAKYQKYPKGEILRVPLNTDEKASYFSFNYWRYFCHNAQQKYELRKSKQEKCKWSYPSAILPPMLTLHQDSNWPLAFI